MRSIEQRALAACISVLAAREEIKRLTQQIGIHFDACEKMADDLREKILNDQDIAYSHEPHLKVYYRYANMKYDIGIGSGPVRGEQEFLSCEHCKAADLVIQDRKTARRRLGAAKAQITRIAKEAERAK